MKLTLKLPKLPTALMLKFRSSSEISYTRSIFRVFNCITAHKSCFVIVTVVVVCCGAVVIVVCDVVVVVVVVVTVDIVFYCCCCYLKYVQNQVSNI